MNLGNHKRQNNKTGQPAVAPLIEPQQRTPEKPQRNDRQALYHRYLDDYDYKGLFREFKPHVWHWPGLTKVVLPMARLIRLALGYETRDRFLKAMRYFGMYRYLYAPYGFLDVLRRSQDLRNPLSLLVLTWLREIGVATPRGV